MVIYTATKGYGDLLIKIWCGQESVVNQLTNEYPLGLPRMAATESDLICATKWFCVTFLQATSQQVYGHHMDTTHTPGSHWNGNCEKGSMRCAPAPEPSHAHKFRAQSSCATGRIQARLILANQAWPPRAISWSLEPGMAPALTPPPTATRHLALGVCGTGQGTTI